MTHEDWTVIAFALRYAFTRRSYAMYLMKNYILDRIDQAKDHEVDLLIRDVKDGISGNDQTESYMNIALELLRDLIAEKNKRGA